MSLNGAWDMQNIIDGEGGILVRGLIDRLVGVGTVSTKWL